MSKMYKKKEVNGVDYIDYFEGCHSVNAEWDEFDYERHQECDDFDYTHDITGGFNYNYHRDDSKEPDEFEEIPF